MSTSAGSSDERGVSIWTGGLRARIRRPFACRGRGARALVEAVDGTALQLANPLAGDPEHAADLRSGACAAVLQAVTQLHYAAVTLLDVAQRRPQLLWVCDR